MGSHFERASRLSLRNFTHGLHNVNREDVRVSVSFGLRGRPSNH